MQNEIVKQIMKDLATKLPEDAIQRTKGSDTKKGYDTTGYGYQSAVDRFNEIIGADWWWSWQIIHEATGNYKNGTPYHDITVQVDIAIMEFKSRSCVGGHTAVSYADALKGAITNGFKKTAAFWGVGRDAFAGTIDDDNQPLPDKAENKSTENVKKIFNGKEIPGKDELAKLNDLPEKTKEGLRLFTGKNAAKAWEICNMYDWNNDKIIAHVSQNLT